MLMMFVQIISGKRTVQSHKQVTWIATALTENPVRAKKVFMLYIFSPWRHHVSSR